jgi:hypothetical protein
MESESGGRGNFGWKNHHHPRPILRKGSGHSRWRLLKKKIEAAMIRVWFHGTTACLLRTPPPGKSPLLGSIKLVRPGIPRNHEFVRTEYLSSPMQRVNSSFPAATTPDAQPSWIPALSGPRSPPLGHVGDCGARGPARPLPTSCHRGRGDGQIALGGSLLDPVAPTMPLGVWGICNRGEGGS